MPTSKKSTGNLDFGFGHNDDVLSLVEEVPFSPRSASHDADLVDAELVTQPCHIPGQQDTFLGFPLFDWGASASVIDADACVEGEVFPESPYVTQ